MAGKNWKRDKEQDVALEGGTLEAYVAPAAEPVKKLRLYGFRKQPNGIEVVGMEVDASAVTVIQGPEFQPLAATRMMREMSREMGEI